MLYPSIIFPLSDFPKSSLLTPCRFLLSDYVTDFAPWSHLEDIAEQMPPIYLGPTPRAMVFGDKVPTDTRAPVPAPLKGIHLMFLT